MGRTRRGHGGQGPGWHSSAQACPQPPRSRPHVSPQVCGASQASATGSTCSGADGDGLGRTIMPLGVMN